MEICFVIHFQKPTVERKRIVVAPPSVSNLVASNGAAGSGEALCS